MSATAVAVEKPELRNWEEAAIATVLAEYISVLRFGDADQADRIYASAQQQMQCYREPVKVYFESRLKEARMAPRPLKAA